jgi:hypothetical protein
MLKRNAAVKLPILNRGTFGVSSKKRNDVSEKLFSGSSERVGGFKNYFDHVAFFDLKFFDSASGSTVENANFSWSSFVAESRVSSISSIYL